ncbi:phosphopantetheine-binding protein [Achromobacter xylosoxidans]|jgi:acyl carrier protein|uniref:phosphopantetheine-binding protein n=1 Tax=Alcaligenes xylosoxydans xylosoxydans TaxID=85698 RepID=UPI0004B8C863|nr:phosphopantetheine-binding protein [Achromobacter xylosoxidans]KOQ31120.1 hypothetical protein ABW35_00255 [Achromobacter xylosoxidans]KOQ31515.1 hypothetical protein ABW34_01120 [Achromobacter xylosoxidans]KOQ34864.1 hypothetical protein ABW36_04290 [Achromobacter xylosoxidans]KOQ47157.1 hypothetical protein ABW37_00290 [Achromobacter xylosoxidans]KOQ48675.1 hypothetical protein ABW38_13545 [Achromobacter xylosoxidans]
MITRDTVISAILEANAAPATQEIRDDISLADQGIDSLSLFNILLILEEREGIKIPDEDLDQLISVQSIVQYLNSR